MAKLLVVPTICSAVRCQPGFVHLLYSSPVTVLGVVMDADANPLKDVRIDHIAVRDRSRVIERSLQTDAAGRFNFKTIAPAIVFRKQAYKSQVARVSSRSREMRIIMTSAAPVDFVPPCNIEPKCFSVDGGGFCFPNSSDIEIGRVGGSVDASEREFVVQTGSGRFVLIHGAGPSWGGPLPRSGDVWSSADYQESTRPGRDRDVIDARGRTSEGKMWRHIGVWGESGFYFGVDPTVAAAFDRVLDRVCIGRN